MSNEEIFTCPPKEVIAKLMNELALGHMDEKIKLSTTLGGSNKTVAELDLSWQTAVSVYTADLPFPVEMTTEMLKPVFMKELLMLAGKKHLFTEGVNLGLWSKQ